MGELSFFYFQYCKNWFIKISNNCISTENNIEIIVHSYKWKLQMNFHLCSNETTLMRILFVLVHHYLYWIVVRLPNWPKVSVNMLTNWSRNILRRPHECVHILAYQSMKLIAYLDTAWLMSLLLLSIIKWLLYPN